MTEESESTKENFLYPTSKYYGEFTPQNLVFNSNLQQFAQTVSYICSLESNGKLTPHEAYEAIRKSYKELRKSKKELLDNTDFRPEDS
ncbi:hypothetical protein Xen7305DRAFT_00040380 [Xenococcus sp. PCC 7305]|uniref:DUF7219 family protein n=1 Tax=Xenococcus sp. PCC 7305 TaxID=102125 RepID=UPI0002AB9D3F|nr:hypothetical protein [Xenococcus sp. PCC 7305]ELS04309.1 hypothetical protein Xen7305DRAFT_00040380 [Xenococcus sp. PCC 7305]